MIVSVCVIGSTGNDKLTRCVANGSTCDGINVGSTGNAGGDLNGSICFFGDLLEVSILV